MKDKIINIALVLCALVLLWEFQRELWIHAETVEVEVEVTKTDEEIVIDWSNDYEAVVMKDGDVELVKTHLAVHGYSWDGNSAIVYVNK